MSWRPDRRLRSYSQALRNTWRHSRWVREHHGYGILQQYRELVRLRRLGLSFEDYYKYALFDAEVFPDFASKATFRSYRLKTEYRRFSDPRLQVVAYQKHLLYRLLASFGLPVPEIRALYNPSPNGFEQHRAMISIGELEDYLRNPNHYPLFGKPSDASHGWGALGLCSVEGETILMADQKRRVVTEVAAEINGFARIKGTYLLLEYCRPREDLVELSGTTLHSLRFVVLMRYGVPEIYRVAALWPRVNSHVSNATELTSGAMGSRVCRETGVVFHVINSTGPNKSFCPVHPDTGRQMEGFQIKGWPEIVALVMEASRAMAPFRMQHWDLSLTDRGPVILEMNFIGDIDPMQMHGPPGAYAEQYRTFAADHKVW